MIVRQAGEAGQLYGSVNARDIAAAFTADGVTIERRQVQLPAALKELGIHQVRIRLHPEVDATVSVNIARTPEEAEIQADPERAAACFDEAGGATGAVGSAAGVLRRRGVHDRVNRRRAPSAPPAAQKDLACPARCALGSAPRVSATEKRTGDG